MNRLIYWLSEELMFVMIYQCHHCCVLLFVRRQQKIFLFGKVLFFLYKNRRVIVSVFNFLTFFRGINSMLGCIYLEGYVLTYYLSIYITPNVFLRYDVTNLDYVFFLCRYS